jgi:hypothetical protein
MAAKCDNVCLSHSGRTITEKRRESKGASHDTAVFSCVTIKSGDMPSPMTREEIEQKMDELAREYVETHDPEIPEEIYRLAPPAHCIGSLIPRQFRKSLR